MKERVQKSTFTLDANTVVKTEPSRLSSAMAHGDGTNVANFSIHDCTTVAAANDTNRVFKWKVGANEYQGGRNWPEPGLSMANGIVAIISGTNAEGELVYIEPPYK